MELRILTYNINKSRDFLFRKHTKESLKKFIIDIDADLVFLQEFSGENITNNELEYFADDIWNDYVYAKNSVYEKGHHGNAILSKFPILQWENINISTNRFEKRGALYAKISIPNLGKKQELELYCVHLDLLQSGRNKQLAKIVEEVEKRSINGAFIIAGDFNDWNLKLDKEIKKRLGVTECSAMMNNGIIKKTFPSLFPIFSLDRVYVRGLSPESCTKFPVIKKQLISDHLPLLAKVNFDK